MQGVECRVQGVECRVQGVGGRVQGVTLLLCGGTRPPRAGGARAMTHPGVGMRGYIHIYIFYI